MASSGLLLIVVLAVGFFFASESGWLKPNDEINDSEPTFTPYPAFSYPTPQPTATIKPTATPIINNDLLHVSGTQLIDSSGNIFFLKGVGVDHNEWFNGFFSKSDVDTLKSNGANLVEIHTVWFHSDIMPIKNVINTAFFILKLDPLVNMITDSGLYCVINQQDLIVGSFQYMPDWMLDGHGYGAAPYSDSVKRQAVKDFYNLSCSVHADNREIWVSAWVWIANHYKDNPYVIFSLSNEPMMGLSFSSSERPVYGQYYASFMEQTIDAIRDTGAKQLIFVDKPYCASEWSDVKKVNRANIVWEDHFYVEDNHEFAWWVNFASESASRFVSGFGQPLYIGEYATLPLNRNNWRNDIINMSLYLGNTGKFCGRSFHSWGMLYGEYDSVLGDSGALNSDADNMFLIQTIFS